MSELSAIHSTQPCYALFAKEHWRSIAVLVTLIASVTVSSLIYSQQGLLDFGSSWSVLGMYATIGSGVLTGINLFYLLFRYRNDEPKVLVKPSPHIAKEPIRASSSPLKLPLFSQLHSMYAPPQGGIANEPPPLPNGPIPPPLPSSPPPDIVASELPSLQPLSNDLTPPPLPPLPPGIVTPSLPLLTLPNGLAPPTLPPLSALPPPPIVEPVVVKLISEEEQNKMLEELNRKHPMDHDKLIKDLQRKNEKLRERTMAIPLMDDDAVYNKIIVHFLIELKGCMIEWLRASYLCFHRTPDASLSMRKFLLERIFQGDLNLLAANLVMNPNLLKPEEIAFISIFLPDFQAEDFKKIGQKAELFRQGLINFLRRFEEILKEEEQGIAPFKNRKNNNPNTQKILNQAPLVLDNCNFDQVIKYVIDKFVPEGNERKHAKRFVKALQYPFYYTFTDSSIGMRHKRMKEFRAQFKEAAFKHIKTLIDELTILKNPSFDDVLKIFQKGSQAFQADLKKIRTT